MDENDRKQMHETFVQRFHRMTELAAQGRGIELLIRIADQTEQGLAVVDESYESMLTSELRFPSPHPRESLPALFADPNERERLTLARDIADKVAHGLYRQARKLIGKYGDTFGLKAELNSEPLPGWKVDAAGHLIEDDGRRIATIVDMIRSSTDNLIVEEYDVFVHNNYDEAAREIFDDAWQRIGAGGRSLSFRVAKLHMFRGFKH